MNFDNIKKMLLDGKINIDRAIYEAHEEGLGFHQIQNLYKISDKIDMNEIADNIEPSLDEMTAAPEAPVAPPQPAKPVAPPRPSRPSPFRPPQPRTMPKPKAKGASPAPEAPPKEAPPREAPSKPSPTPRPSKPNPFSPPQPRTIPKPKASDYSDQMGAAPAAPTAPPREAPTRPTTPTTPRPSKPNPFSPPQPRTMPKPKARRTDGMMEMISSTVVPVIMEAYEDESHRSTQDFWRDLPRNREHTFGKHPILAMHGANLSKDAFDFTSEKMQQSGGAINSHQFMQIVMQIMQLESRHKEELQELAKDITVKIWGVPREMLETDLGPMDMGGGDDFGEEDDQEEEEVPELTDEIRPQVNKRISMNTMTQGSAVHAMYSMHHLVDRAINKISPQLLQLYNRVASGSVHQYWLLDIPAIAAQLKNMKAGEVRVEFPQDRQEPEAEIDPEEGLGDEDTWDENKDPRVRASAVIFPVLCQELSKGVMEVLTMHGLADLDDEQSKAVIHHGDKLEDEPWLIQVGPALWRKFLTVVPKGIRMADIITALSLQEPDEVHKILMATLEHPENAKQLLQELLKDPEEFDIDEPGNEFQEPEEPAY